MARDLQNRYEFRHKWLMLAMLFLSVVGAGLFATGYLSEMASRETVKENIVTMTLLSSKLTDELEKHAGAAKAISGSPWIPPALVSGTGPEIARANIVLDRYNTAMGASVSYLMDRKGKTIASSNRNSPDSFVGKSYQFRPYFKQAIGGNAGRYFALGVTSLKRGFYASHPVRDGKGSVVGVVAIKKDLDDMEANLSGDTSFFFLNPQGFIFLSNKKEMLFKSLWPMSRETQQALLASKQFGEKPFEAVLPQEITDGMDVTLDGKRYLVSRRAVDPEGWSIVLLASTDRIRIYRWIGILATFFVCLLIAIFSAVLYVTERSKEAIRQSERRFHLLLHSAGEGIFGVDLTGRVTFINPAALHMVGFAEEEILGQRVHEMIHHSHRDGSHYPVEECPMYRSYTRAVENHVMDEVLWRRDGSHFPVDYSSTPITADDKTTGAVITFRDITDRKRAEEALRESEARFRELAKELEVIAEIGKVVGSSLDIDEVFDRFAVEVRKLIPFDRLAVNLHRLEEVNVKVAYTFGEKIPGRFKGDLFPLKGSTCEILTKTRAGLYSHPKNVETMTPFSSSYLSVKAGLRSLLRVPLIYRDEVIGSLHFGLKTTDAYSNRELHLAERIGAQIAGAVSNAQLFTDLKNTEMSLRESEGRFRQLADSTWEGIFIHRDGTILDVNQAICDMFGYGAAEIVGKSALDFIAPEYTERVIQELKRQSLQPSLSSMEGKGRKKDGTLFPIETLGRPISHKNLSARVTAVRDLTKQKQAEADKERLEDQNRQLQKTESLGRMAGAIAHHFNNQLGVVIGNLEMAIDDLPSDAGPVNKLTAAMQAAMKAAEVSNHMLTYLGQTVEKHELLDISDTCRRSLPMIQAAISGKALLEIDLPAPGPVIRANANQMEQLMTNLITNAAETVGQGENVINLTMKTVSPGGIPAVHRLPVEWQPQDKAYACMEVRDTGHGIAERDIEKIFDPFFTSKSTGRGMGLAVVLGIVKAHHGAVTVESTPGRGSTFRVFFPLSEEQPLGQQDEAKNGGAVPMGAFAPMGKEGLCTILLVDDEKMLRDMASAMLRRLGHSVIEAADGVDAVDLFRQHRDEIRCVICDLTMPRTIGWETLTALRKMAPDLPVILASGYDRAQAMAGDHPDLPDVFLGKPYKLKGLRNAIGQALAGRRG